MVSLPSAVYRTLVSNSPRELFMANVDIKPDIQLILEANHYIYIGTSKLCDGVHVETHGIRRESILVRDDYF